jgi:methionine biosynthesis protein MetW
MQQVDSKPTAVATKCLLCSSARLHAISSGVRDFEYGAPGLYDWVECNDCGLIRLLPEPSDEVLSIAYPSHYHAYVKAASSLTRNLYQVLRKKFAKRVASFVEEGGAVLDVGCSTGDQLMEIRSVKACALYGVEYREEAAEEARARGITVWQGELADADVPHNTMDVVIMQHVLEHVRNPVDTMKRLIRCTKSGGRVIGELPNFDSWDAQLFQQYWGGGHAPRHLWHFTPKSLTSLLEACGYQNVKIKPSLHTGHWALSFQNYLRRDAAGCEDLVSGRTWYYPPLLLATVPINVLQMAFMKTGVMQFEAEKP